MTPKSFNVADQVRELGLQLGDMIEGWEGAHGARLVLKFLGTEAAVFDEWLRVDDGTWRYLGESAEWDLGCRDWVRVEQPTSCCKPWTPEEIADTDSMLRHLAAGMPPPPEGTDEWAAKKAAATDAQIDTLLAHPDWIARLRDLLADLPATEAQRRALQCIRDEDMTRWDDECDRAVVAALEIAAHCALHAGGQPVTVPAIPTTCRCGGCTDSRCPRRQGDPA